MPRNKDHLPDPGQSGRSRMASLAGRRAVLATAAASLAIPFLHRSVRAQSSQTPEQALDNLMDGNRRFVARNLQACAADLAELRQATAEQQEPFAAVLSCADSRVPVELIFDQSIGHVFVTRVAGNIASAEIIASLEYGAAVLGTRTILVLGHGGCGAIKAAMAGKAAPGQISTLYRSLRPAVDRAHGDLQAAIEANANLQAKLLRDASPVIGDLVKQKKLSVNAAFYELGSGQVRLLTSTG